MTENPEKIKKMKIPNEVRKEAIKLGRELTKLSQDSTVLEKSEEFQKKISTLSIQKLFQQFSI